MNRNLIIGIILTGGAILLVGTIFKIQHWPYGDRFRLFGTIIVLIGAGLLAKNKNNRNKD